MVECHPSKVDVAGSNPVSRSFFLETRRCGSCGEAKPIDDFTFRSRASGKRHTTCKACQQRFKRTHYERNRHSYLRKSAEQKKQAIGRCRVRILQYLQKHSCVDCGENDPNVLEFDHIEGKRRSITQIVLDGVAWERIMEEITRCEVRCANCHRKKTARQQGWYKRLGL